MVKAKSYRIPQELINKAKKALHSKTETEAIVLALTWVAEEAGINEVTRRLAGSCPDFGK